MAIGTLLSAGSLAVEIYEVKQGDTLSQIVRKYFPGESVYGDKGKIKEVLSLNPEIKNSHRIYPKQKIKLEYIPMKQSVAPEVAQEENKAQLSREVSEKESKEGWNISALYGAKYLSLTQSGALGNAEVGVLFLNHLSLNSEFILDDWSFDLQFNTYKFKYEAINNGGSKQMNDLRLLASYKWFTGGVQIEQNPLFRKSNAGIEMARMTTTNLALGLKHEIELPTRKPTSLSLGGWLTTPLSSSSSNADIKLSSVSGFGLKGRAELKRLIVAREGYSVHAAWLTQAGFQKTSQRVNWDTSNGKIESQILDVSTSLGVLINF